MRWARGHLKFFKPLSLAVCPEGEGKEEGKGEGLSQDMVLDNDIAKELLSVDGGVNANLRRTRFVAAATVHGHTATKKIGKKKNKTTYVWHGSVGYYYCK